MKSKFQHIRMLIRITVSVSVAIFASIMEMQAQECDQIFSHLSIDEGLSANHVKAILRDKDGFLWIGTTNGLNRYDGASVKRYICYDHEKQRGNNNIGALYEAPDGIIWIGTDRGGI